MKVWFFPSVSSSIKQLHILECVITSHTSRHEDLYFQWFDLVSEEISGLESFEFFIRIERDGDDSGGCKSRRQRGSPERFMDVVKEDMKIGV